MLQLKPKPYDLLDYRDVNGKKRGSPTSMRDPLNPVYVYTRPNGDIYSYGQIEGNKAKATVQDLGNSLNQHIDPDYKIHDKYSLLKPVGLAQG